MTLKRVLYPIAVAGSVLNLAAVGFAAVAAEPVHATVHGALALAFGLWAQRLRRDSRGGKRDPRVDVLEDEISDLRRELTETQEGLHFAERLLTQRPAARPAEAQRYAPKQPDSASRRELEDDRDPNVPPTTSGTE